MAEQGAGARPDTVEHPDGGDPVAALRAALRRRTIAGPDKQDAEFDALHADLREHFPGLHATCESVDKDAGSLACGRSHRHADADISAHWKFHHTEVCREAAEGDGSPSGLRPVFARSKRSEECMNAVA